MSLTNSNQCNNKIDEDLYINIEEFSFLLGIFSEFLWKKHKRTRAIELYVREAKEYLKWFCCQGFNDEDLFCENNMLEYETYLKCIKMGKVATIKIKLGMIVVFKDFFIGNYLNNEHQFRKDNLSIGNLERKSGHYNYLTRSFIKL